MKKSLAFVLVTLSLSAFSQDSNLLESAIKTKKVLVSDLMGDFFSNTNCLPNNESLKRNFKRKIERYGASEIVPGEIKFALGREYDSVVEFVEDITLQGMMHVYWHEKENQRRFLSGSPTYENFNPMELIHDNRGKFLYTSDCSGFTSVLANSNLGMGSSELAATAKNSSNAKYIYFAARGKLTSPIALTANPTLRSSTTISPEDQVSLLWSVLNVMNQNKVSSIIVPVDVDVLTFAIEGDKNIQGKLDVEAGGGVSFAIGSIEMGGKAGLGYSKSLIFSSPNSAIIAYGDKLKVSKDEIKQAYVSALQQIRFRRDAGAINFIVTANLSQNYCLTAGWYTKVESSEAAIFERDVSTTWNQGVCKFELNSSEIGNISNWKISIFVKRFGFNVPLEADESMPLVSSWTI